MWDLLKYKNNIAIINEKEEFLTYNQVYDIGEEIVKKIYGRCLIFSLCSNSIGSVVGYIAFLNHKIVPLMLDHKIDRTLIHRFLELYCPDYLWLPNEDVNDFGGDIVYSIYGYTLLKQKKMQVFPLYKDLALLLTTSGSTGSPKFVRQSYENINVNTQDIVNYLNLDSTERPITTLPMNYTYGLSIINSHLMVGATIILSPYTVIQREFWDVFTSLEATSFGGVPYTYEMLVKLHFFDRKLPSLRTMTQAGGKLLPLLHKKFAEYANKENKKFIVMYGQSEATARMAYLPADKSLDKCGSIGIAVPSGALCLLNDKDEIIKTPNIVGELLYKGKNVTLGYANSGRDLIKGDECYGILHTGDMAKFDDEGYFTIVGRKKRFLKIFGNRMDLDETEILIRSHFNNFECACTGKDDIMYIFITDKDSISDVKRFLVEKTKINQIAFKIKYLPSIPKNNYGKVLYSKLEHYYD